MNIEIRRWDNNNNNNIIVCGKYESIKDCLEKNKNKSFYRANLSSADLRSADLSYAGLRFAILSSADLRSADLSYADLRFADLRYANLRHADLSYADLRFADLRSADLSSTDLSSADLRYANLSSAKNISKYLTTSLYGMLDQIGKIRAYKIVNQNNVGIYNGGLVYKIGDIVEEKKANTNEREHCAAGINLATLDWCMKEWKKGYKILICEFTKKDIAAIPIGSDGKFRVFRCKIIGEKNLKELGLTEKKG